MEKRQTVGIALLCGVIGTGATVAVAGPPIAAPQRPAGAAAFLEAEHCYRIAFPIDGPPNYKVLELLDGGWIRAEVDAGSAKAQRQSLWINTAQIVTMRETRCSE